METCLARLTESIGDHGLRLQTPKCELWVPNPETLPGVCLPHLRDMINRKCEGLIVCGSCLSDDTAVELPLGSDSFCSSWLLAKAIRLEKQLRQITYLPQAAPDASTACQIAFRLLVDAVPARLTHLWRSLPWPAQCGFLEAVEEQLMDSFKELAWFKRMIYLV